MSVEFVTPIGCLSFSLENNKLVSMTIRHGRCSSKVTASKQTPGEKHITTQLHSYFTKATSFESITVEPAGTVFEKKVWKALCKIPPGETRTYGHIARLLNSSAQAVGNACRKNPVQLVIPCHRVVSASGIGGYAGKTSGKQLELKRRLLEHEGVAL